MTTEREKMLAGDLYDPSDPELGAGRERARRLTRRFNRTDETETEKRKSLLRELFGSVGDSPHVEPPFRCDYGDNIRVGDGFYANFDCVILDVCRVEMGDNCWLGPGAHIYTATHPLDAETRVEGLEYGDPVTIGDNVWVSGRAVVNPGVEIGDDAVIASGAVVTDDVPENVVVGGNPAEVVKRLDDESDG